MTPKPNPCAACELVEPGPAACCKGWAIPVTVSDVERLAGRARIVPTRAGWRFSGEIERTVAGDCSLLGHSGCAAYDLRPEVCRVFVIGACGVNVRTAGVRIGPGTPAVLRD